AEMPRRCLSRSSSRASCASRCASSTAEVLDNPVVSTLRLALCQLNPTVGEIGANERAIATALAGARDAGAGLAICGELAITGYPPEDLLHKEHFVRDARAAVDR